MRRKSPPWRQLLISVQLPANWYRLEELSFPPWFLNAICSEFPTSITLPHWHLPPLPRFSPSSIAQFDRCYIAKHFCGIDHRLPPPPPPHTHSFQWTRAGWGKSVTLRCPQGCVTSCNLSPATISGVVKDFGRSVWDCVCVLCTCFGNAWTVTSGRSWSSCRTCSSSLRHCRM